MSLHLEIKELIIEALDLEDVTPDDIETEGPLFGEGRGLDSIDALEIAVALEERFGIKVEPGEDTQAAFSSVAALAKLVGAGA